MRRYSIVKITFTFGQFSLSTIKGEAYCHPTLRFTLLRDPCRLCRHVVVVVGLVCFDDLCGYAVDPLIRQERDEPRLPPHHGHTAQVVASGKRLLIRRAFASEPKMA